MEKLYSHRVTPKTGAPAPLAPWLLPMSIHGKIACACRPCHTSLQHKLSVLYNCVRIIAQCSLQPDPGPCEALTVRYFWNPNTRQCEEFNYGGCEGNPNNFLDRKSCESQCGKPMW